MNDKRGRPGRSEPFRETRKHHSEEAAEDYTELIYDLIEKEGEARTGRIAELLGISHVTAVRTIQRLQREGFVMTDPRKPVVLTSKGKKLAKFCKRRHEVLLEFFLSIGIPRATAIIDVEGAEHHISRTSLRYIETFLKRDPGNSF